MPPETEIKLKISNLKAFERHLKRLGAKPAAPSGPARVHEENQIFDTPDGGLAKHGQLLRLRTETPADNTRATGKKAGKKKSAAHRKDKKPSAPAPNRQILTFKSPSIHHGAADPHPHSASHKVREEIEAQVSDSGNLMKIFEGLGMRGWFRYEKFRTTYQLPATRVWAKGLLIELDETPIGTFVELEGPPNAIDRAAQELGFSRRDYILTNYLSLYISECRRKGVQPQNMLFPEKSKKNRS